MTLADLREALHDVLSETGPGDRPRLYRILRAMAVEAEAGNVRAAALILDRAFGAPQPKSDGQSRNAIIYLDGAAYGHPAAPERSAEAGVAAAG